MRPATTRRAWTWACAVCLAALAGLLSWPAAEFPRLGPPDGLRILRADAGGIGSSAGTGRTDVLTAGARDDPEPASEEARDAVADRPGSLKTTREDWAQSPWRVYWNAAGRAPAPVPVPQAVPRVYQRGPGEKPRAMPRLGGKEPPVAAKGAVPGGRTSSTAARDPAQARERTQEVLSRLMAYRAPQAGALMTKTSAARLSVPRAGTAQGRAEGAPARHSQQAEARPERLPRWRPVLLSQALGARSIRPPSLDGKVPDLRRLERLFPKKGPDGRLLRWRPAPAAALEKLKPPEADAARCRRPRRHWHPGLPAFHAGRAWAVSQAEGWAWLERVGRRWWAWTAPQEPIWLWHEDHWWWRSQDVWFMLHQGEAWGYRTFAERRTEGLVHPGTGTRLEYSADGERVAIITPGDGAWLFDARSGEVLQRWSEEQMPRRPQPRAPSALSFPR
ncbi:MAG: hypothetical protein HY926_15600 [Elusimicrobia bacterium]|nr:hypothetical protein [Elusimicrobiota bacterium]